ncbi:SAM-dependent methyltransferase-like protein, partial [Dinothrombium tinctorium]
MLKTGEIAFNHKFGKSYYEFLNDDSVYDNVDLMKFMQDYTKIIQGKVSSHYDFSKFKHIVDVGGNNGSFLIEILHNTPAYVHGT